MLRKAWNTNLRISLVLMVAATFGTTAWADGTHGATFTVKNQSGGKILVYVYDGDDANCEIAHKEYVIDNDGERTAKCHGRGWGRCKFKVFAGKTIFDDPITRTTTCEIGTRYYRVTGVDSVNKGETCTITGWQMGDYNCQ